MTNGKSALPAGIITANIGQIGYTDNKVSVANIGQIGYTDNKVSVANIGIKGYVDDADITSAYQITNPSANVALTIAATNTRLLVAPTSDPAPVSFFTDVTLPNTVQDGRMLKKYQLKILLLVLGVQHLIFVIEVKKL